MMERMKEFDAPWAHDGPTENKLGVFLVTIEVYLVCLFLESVVSFPYLLSTNNIHLGITYR